MARSNSNTSLPTLAGTQTFPPKSLSALIQYPQTNQAWFDLVVEYCRSITQKGRKIPKLSDVEAFVQLLTHNLNPDEVSAMGRPIIDALREVDWDA